MAANKDFNRMRVVLIEKVISSGLKNLKINKEYYGKERHCKS